MKAHKKTAHLPEFLPLLGGGEKQEFFPNTDSGQE